MRESIVTTIPKSGSKLELKNKRGIFKLSVLRSILLRLIYDQKYEMIDSNMSDNNIGAGQNKSSRNHICLINGINHKQNSSKKNLHNWFCSLLTMSVSVNTYYGSTEPIAVPELVAQGDLFDPLQTAVQVDSMKRKMEEEDKARVEAGEQGLLFRYKGIVVIPSLGLMDTNITVSEAEVKAEQTNIS